MSQRSMTPGRFMALPATIVVIGIALSVGGFLQLDNEARLESSQSLAETGLQLIRYTEGVTQDAVDQTRATKGLFETTIDVSGQQFDHFAETIEDTHGSGVAYAPRITAVDLDAYLAQTRELFPIYRLHNADLTTAVVEGDRVYWPLLHTSGLEAGFIQGFDFGSHPLISQAIDSSLRTGSPAATPFIEVPGDETPGDFVIVTIIGDKEDPQGLAVVTLQLDELTSERVQELIGAEATIALSQETDIDNVADPDQSRWVGNLAVLGQPVAFILDSQRPISGSIFAPWLLALGTGTSFLLGWVVYGRKRRTAMSTQLAVLEKTLVEKDRFLASISHAVRTPMTSIVGALEILNDDQIHLELPERAGLLRDARISALELERLTEDYLTAARISSGAFTLKSLPVDLDILTTRIVASLEIPRGVAIHVEPLGRCQGDLIRIQQIIRNLIRNATQHALTTITVRSNSAPPFVYVEVVNNGEPILPDVANTLFTPFEKGTVPGQPESIGLGLSVARDLARIMGGDLTYRYDDGNVVFRLALAMAVPVTGVGAADIAGPIPRHRGSAAPSRP